MAAQLVEGWTEPIEYQLLRDAANVDLTGATVTMLLYDSNETLVAYSGTVTVVNATAGVVRFNPSATDLVEAKSPYFVRFKVTDVNSKISYWPSGEAERWRIRLP